MCSVGESNELGYHARKGNVCVGLFMIYVSGLVALWGADNRENR